MNTTKQTAREQILAEYSHVNGVITSLGKFEGEPVFAPHFWDIALQGFSDRDDGKVFSFIINRDDKERSEWPELTAWLGRRRILRMREDSQGFVYCF